MLERIGVGGMAEVWKARVAGIGGFEKILVLKKILPAFASNKKFIEMLLAEARLCAVLQHNNIVQTFENGKIGEVYYVAMEYVPGYDLFKILSRATQVGRHVPPTICLYIASEVAKGLDYAHNAKSHGGEKLNLIHRDVSPSNVLISLAGEVKVTDFGVARATLGDSRSKKDSRAGVLKGKLGYMSPEQVTGKPFDQRSDIFSLGIILYESITLKRLFLGRTDLETLVNIRDAKLEHKFVKHSYIPEGIRGILRKTLSRNPDERYDSSLDMHDDMLNLLFEMKTQVTNRTLANFIEELFDPSLETKKLESTEDDPPVDSIDAVTDLEAMPLPPKQRSSRRPMESMSFPAVVVDQEREGIEKERSGAQAAKSEAEAAPVDPKLRHHPVDEAPSLLGGALIIAKELDKTPAEAAAVGDKGQVVPRWAVESAKFGPGSAGAGGDEPSQPDASGASRTAASTPASSAPPQVQAEVEGFYIKTGDGHDLGPLSRDNLIAMIRSRSVGAGVQISTDGETFKAIEQVEQFLDEVEQATAGHERIVKLQGTLDHL